MKYRSFATAIHRRRYGTSLVELMFAISAGVVLLSLCATLLQRTMRIQIASRADFQLQRTLQRLDRTFRDDVHQAQSAEIDPAVLAIGTLLRLQSPTGEVVEYRTGSRSLERVVIRASKIASRDGFLFPRDVQFKLSSQLPQLLVMSLSSDESLAHVSPVHASIQAVLHRDRTSRTEPANE